jgi:hypothetical protein
MRMVFIPGENVIGEVVTAGAHVSYVRYSVGGFESTEWMDNEDFEEIEWWDEEVEG